LISGGRWADIFCDSHIQTLTWAMDDSIAEDAGVGEVGGIADSVCSLVAECALHRAGAASEGHEFDGWNGSR
jgi:hypothetical protein